MPITISTTAAANQPTSTRRLAQKPGHRGTAANQGRQLGDYGRNMPPDQVRLENRVAARARVFAADRRIQHNAVDPGPNTGMVMRSGRFQKAGLRATSAPHILLT